MSRRLPVSVIEAGPVGEWDERWRGLNGPVRRRPMRSERHALRAHHHWEQFAIRHIHAQFA